MNQNIRVAAIIEVPEGESIINESPPQLSSLLESTEITTGYLVQTNEIKYSSLIYIGLLICLLVIVLKVIIKSK